MKNILFIKLSTIRARIAILICIQQRQWWTFCFGWLIHHLPLSKTSYFQ